MHERKRYAKCRPRADHQGKSDGGQDQEDADGVHLGRLKDEPGEQRTTESGNGHANQDCRVVDESLSAFLEEAVGSSEERSAGNRWVGKCRTGWSSCQY